MGWTAGSLVLTYFVLIDVAIASYLNWIVVLPFWAAELVVAGLLVWFFGSITRFTFNSDELAIDWSLLGLHRKCLILRADVRLVVLVKDGEACETNMPIWGLAIITDRRLNVLKHRFLEHCTWLGLILARWADVRFEPVERLPMLDGLSGV